MANPVPKAVIWTTLTKVIAKNCYLFGALDLDEAPSCLHIQRLVVLGARIDLRIDLELRLAVGAS